MCWIDEGSFDMVTAPDGCIMKLDGSRMHVLAKGSPQLLVGSYSLRERKSTSFPATYGSSDAVISLKSSEGQDHHAHPYIL